MNREQCRFIILIERRSEMTIGYAFCLLFVIFGHIFDDALLSCRNTGDIAILNKKRYHR